MENINTKDALLVILTYTLIQVNEIADKLNALEMSDDEITVWLEKNGLKLSGGFR